MFCLFSGFNDQKQWVVRWPSIFDVWSCGADWSYCRWKLGETGIITSGRVTCQRNVLMWNILASLPQVFTVHAIYIISLCRGSSSQGLQWGQGMDLCSEEFVLTLSLCMQEIMNFKVVPVHMAMEEIWRYLSTWLHAFLDLPWSTQAPNRVEIHHERLPVRQLADFRQRYAAQAKYTLAAQLWTAGQMEWPDALKIATDAFDDVPIWGMCEK